MICAPSTWSRRVMDLRPRCGCDIRRSVLQAAEMSNQITATVMNVRCGREPGPTARISSRGGSSCGRSGNRSASAMTSRRSCRTCGSRTAVIWRRARSVRVRSRSSVAWQGRPAPMGKPLSAWRAGPYGCAIVTPGSRQRLSAWPWHVPRAQGLCGAYQMMLQPNGSVLSMLTGRPATVSSMAVSRSGLRIRAPVRESSIRPV
jgi:hypothetical protein